MKYLFLILGFLLLIGCEQPRPNININVPIQPRPIVRPVYPIPIYPIPIRPYCPPHCPDCR